MFTLSLKNVKKDGNFADLNYLMKYKRMVPQNDNKRGRPKLKEARVPFTTSLTIKNKGKLEILSSIRRQRKADVLNEILESYFNNDISPREQKLLDAL